MSQKYKVILAVLGLSLISTFWILWSSFNPVNEKALVKFISVGEILDSNSNERVRIGGIVADSSIIISPSSFIGANFIIAPLVSLK